MITFGKTQYQWHPNRKEGYADPGGPPVSSEIPGAPNTRYTLPAASITVFRGNLTDNPTR